MKKAIYIIIGVVALTIGVASCSEDEFTDSIFDTTEYYLDKTSYTFALDTFLKVTYLEPYNLKYIYKMEDIGSDMQKNLIPASLEKSTELAVLTKYLWYDVYKECCGEEFLKIYSPRIIHVIGSPSYNPSSGTETLGEAEGGLKITLYNANHLDVDDIANLNEKFFKTMHHEFGHILAQNYTYPTSFALISNGIYDPIDWANTADSVALTKGFVSPYASSQAREDWVEVIANYIVKDYKTWDEMLSSASYDWETTDVDAATFNANVKKCEAGTASRDSVGYYVSTTSTSGGSDSQYKVQRKLISRDTDDNPLLDENGNMIFLSTDGIDGQSVILQKLELCKTYLADYFDADLDEIRDMVQQRQWVTDDSGEFVLDTNGDYINALTQPSKADSSITQMELLLDWVNQYKALQE